MRSITFQQTSVFFILLAVILTLGVISTQLLLGGLALGDFRAIVLLLGGFILIYVYAFLVYRLFLVCVPLKEGVIEEGTAQEFSAQVNILFYLLLFNPLIKTYGIPIPIQRLIYLALGAKLGPNTYSAGTILDPQMTCIGANSIIGHGAVLYSHAIEGQHFAFETIRIGDNVTIGVNAVVMSGVQIGDGAIVSAGAVVTKGSVIGAGEVWGGVPAKKLKKAAV